MDMPRYLKHENDKVKRMARKFASTKGGNLCNENGID